MSFPQNIKNLNLSPYKYSLCCIVNRLIKSQELNFQIDILQVLDYIKPLLLEFSCELSYDIFKIRLNEYISNGHLSNKEKITEIIGQLLEEGVSRITSINELYIFFNYEIRELKTKCESNNYSLENGGIIDNFIRKCLFAFYKLSFEDLSKLFKNIQSYFRGEELSNLQITNKESEILFEAQLKESSKFLTKENEELNNKILSNFKFKHKFYFLKNTPDSLSNIHKFFDYNMRSFYNDVSFSESKIHYSLFNIVEYYFINSFYDQAVQVLFECIKLNQSNLDHEGLLKCFLWLQKIYRNIGKCEIVSQN
jgi:hypothetical protein